MTRLLRLLLVLLAGMALVWGVLPAGAQSSTSSRPGTRSQGPTVVPPVSGTPALAPVPGQRRGMTNEMRRAAAARNAQRKLAAGQKNQVIQPARNGGRK